MRGIVGRPRRDRRFYDPSVALTVSSAPRARGGQLAIIPASQLHFTEQWDRIVQELPAGEVLLVMPPEGSSMSHLLRLLIPHLRARGRHITQVDAIPT